MVYMIDWGMHIDFVTLLIQVTEIKPPTNRGFA